MGVWVRIRARVAKCRSTVRYSPSHHRPHKPTQSPGTENKSKQANPHPRQSSRKSQKSYTPLLRVVDPLARTTLHIGKAKSPLLTLPLHGASGNGHLTHRNIVLRACLLVYPPFSPSLSYLDRQAAHGDSINTPPAPTSGKILSALQAIAIHPIINVNVNVIVIVIGFRGSHVSIARWGFLKRICSVVRGRRHSSKRGGCGASGRADGGLSLTLAVL